MILLADSGSTKTNWLCIQNGQTKTQAQSPGINPFFQNEEEITNKLKKHLSDLATLPIKKIFFYGAGCAFPEKNQIVANALGNFFSNSNPEIQIESDLVGAARALCQHQPGITCILGTGSNSCYYNGEELEQNVSPLGFILGDEGSGAVLGRLLVSDFLKNQLPVNLAEKFQNKYSYSPAEILDKVYKQAFPNRFLAGFAPFLSENIEDTYCREIVVHQFNLFFQRNVLQYSRHRDLPIHFTGSVAFHFKELLRETGRTNGLNIGTILKDPMKGIVTYHSFNNVI
ncbi:MAG: ATPase [Marinifilaceae bacterium]